MFITLTEVMVSWVYAYEFNFKLIKLNIKYVQVFGISIILQQSS